MKKLLLIALLITLLMALTLSSLAYAHTEQPGRGSARSGPGQPNPDAPVVCVNGQNAGQLYCKLTAPQISP